MAGLPEKKQSNRITVATFVMGIRLLFQGRRFNNEGNTVTLIQRGIILISIASCLRESKQI
jgi:hypothetical protein